MKAVLSALDHSVDSILKVGSPVRCAWCARSSVCHAVEHGRAVFVLADMEVRLIHRRLDEIPRRMDLEQAGALLADLAAKDEAGREGIAVGRQFGLERTRRVYSLRRNGRNGIP